MATEKHENDEKDESTKNTGLKPDPETLHTTDPQEHMKGPLSSLMQKVEDKAEDNDRKDKQEGNL